MSEKMTIKEAFHWNRRALMIWWKREPKMFFSILSSSIVSGVVPFVGIYFSAQIINELAGRRNPQRLWELVIITLTVTSVLSFVKAGLNRWRSVYQDSSNFFKENKIYFDKMLAMDYCDVENSGTHDLLFRVEQNRQWTGWGIKKIVGQFEALVSGVICIAGAVTMTVSLFTLQIPEHAGGITILNHPICILGIMALMLSVTVMGPALSVKANEYMVKCADEARFGNRVFGYYMEFASERKRALDIRIYNQEKICNKCMDDCRLLTGMERVSRGPLGLLKAASQAVSYVFSAVVMIFVCLKAWGGAFGVGSITQYISAITALSGGVSGLISTLGDMRNNASFLRTTFEFLDIPNDMYQGSLTVEKRSDRKYEIEFRDVSFKYPGSDNWALRHVSIKFQVGQKLAVVGQNGSGKTTFIKLLCRLYDPTEGEILLNGINIRKYNYKEYMNVFSVVFQDFKLLALALGKNIAAGEDFDEERVKDCLRVAGFEEKLQALEQGLNTSLYKDLDNQGVEVSGGEEQKIAIARALYKDAPFVILDEPTAALDPVSEYEIYSRFDELVENKTAIYISHRLSSCRFCDEIAVFDKGSVVQKGSHEKLLSEKQGKYFELWEVQAQYYTSA